MWKWLIWDWLKAYWLSLGGFIVVIVLWFHFGGYPIAMGNGPDKFDSINSLFAGLAFVGMLCTLSMQRQELSLQSKELKATRDELELTRKAAEEQADIQMKALLLKIANSEFDALVEREIDIKQKIKELDAKKFNILMPADDIITKQKIRNLQKSLEQIFLEKESSLPYAKALKQSLAQTYAEHLKSSPAKKQDTSARENTSAE